MTQTTESKSAEGGRGPQTLADLFAGRVGRIRSSGQGRLSEKCAETFAEYLEEKRHAGHL